MIRIIVADAGIREEIVLMFGFIFKFTNENKNRIYSIRFSELCFRIHFLRIRIQQFFLNADPDPAALKKRIRIQL